MRALKNLICFDRMEEARPEILSRPIRRPIFITGLPRSGTTFLHTLLAQDPGIAVPLSWQLVYPYPSRLGALGADFRSSWVDMQFQVMLLLSPELKDLHPLRQKHLRNAQILRLRSFKACGSTAPIASPPTRTGSVTTGITTPTVSIGGFCNTSNSQDPGRRWVLKSPDHVFALDAIKAIYPDAQIVFLHRDPLSVLASVAKLTEVLRRPFGRSVDRMEIGRQVSTSWIDGASRMIAASAHDPSILHLHYKDVVSAPFDAVATLYRHCGLSSATMQSGPCRLGSTGRPRAETARAGTA